MKNGFFDIPLSCPPQKRPLSQKIPCDAIVIESACCQPCDPISSDRTRRKTNTKFECNVQIFFFFEKTRWKSFFLPSSSHCFLKTVRAKMEENVMGYVRYLSSIYTYPEYGACSNWSRFAICPCVGTKI